MVRSLLASVLLLALAVPTFAAAPENRPGWVWRMEPAPLHAVVSRNATVVLAETREDGTVAVYMAARGEEENRLEPVAFDAAGNRLPLTPGTGGRSADIRLQVWTLEAGAGTVDRVGVEELTAEGRVVAAAEARKRAAARDLEVLPLPVVGEDYTFTLTTVDGTVIDSHDYLGGILLLHGWSSWCGACLDNAEALGPYLEANRAKGLYVLGLSFTDTPEEATEGAAAHGMTWPQVQVPGDEEARELWYDATGIRPLPHFLIVDRNGKLLLNSNHAPGLLDTLTWSLLPEKERKKKTAKIKK